MLWYHLTYITVLCLLVLYCNVFYFIALIFLPYSFYFITPKYIIQWQAITVHLYLKSNVHYIILHCIILILFNCDTILYNYVLYYWSNLLISTVYIKIYICSALLSNFLQRMKTEAFLRTIAAPEGIFMYVLGLAFGRIGQLFILCFKETFFFF